MSQPPRLVLDTNIVLSALLFTEGRLGWLRQAWQGGKCVPLVSSESVQELLRVLNYPKFRLSPAEQQELLADYLPWCETVVFNQPPPVPTCRDPHDEKFLVLALAAKADVIITGDADLHALAATFPIRILTAQQAWEILGLNL